MEETEEFSPHTEKATKKNFFLLFLSRIESSRERKLKIIYSFHLLVTAKLLFPFIQFFYVSFEQIETCQTYARECLYNCVCVCTLSDEMEKVNLYFFLAPYSSFRTFFVELFSSTNFFCFLFSVHSLCSSVNGLNCYLHNFSNRHTHTYVVTINGQLLPSFVLNVNINDFLN